MLVEMLRRMIFRQMLLKLSSCGGEKNFWIRAASQYLYQGPDSHRVTETIEAMATQRRSLDPEAASASIDSDS